MNHRRSSLFLTLMRGLDLGTGAFHSRRTTTLTLTDDRSPHTMALLMSLLTRAKSPTVLSAVRRTLIALKPPTLPRLRQLGLALTGSIITLTPSRRLLTHLHRHAIGHALTGVLILRDNGFGKMSLDNAGLTRILRKPSAFALILRRRRLTKIQ